MKTDTSIQITTHNGIPTVASTEIADRCDVTHQAVLKLIETYQPTMEQHFGPVGFEIRAQTREANGGSIREFDLRIAHLTEEQSTFLITLMRNTAPVVAFKAGLTAAFFALRAKVNELPLGPQADRILRMVDQLLARGITPETAAQLVLASFSAPVAPKLVAAPVKMLRKSGWRGVQLTDRIFAIQVSDERGKVRTIAQSFSAPVANLIIHAPDLLFTLQACLPTLEQFGEDSEPVIIARRAIANATAA